VEACVDSELQFTLNGSLDGTLLEPHFFPCQVPHDLTGQREKDAFALQPNAEALSLDGLLTGERLP
jgi:hypothetical protein